MQASMESCAGKTVMAGIMGGGLGAMFGLFMASVRAHSSTHYSQDQENTRLTSHVDALRHPHGPTTYAHASQHHRNNDPSRRRKTHNPHLDRPLVRHSLHPKRLLHNRAAPPSSRRRRLHNVQPDIPDRGPAAAPTTEDRPARHVPVVSEFGPQFCARGLHLQWDGMRDRGPESEERSLERCRWRLYHGGCASEEGGPAGCGCRVSGFRGLLRRHRCVYADAGG
jgi:hypothetical protein